MTRRTHTQRRYTVACLAGGGIGAEVMAEASRAVDTVSRLHGFHVEDVHAPLGGVALTQSGHHLPASTRAAYANADAVLVAASGVPALDGVAAELDLSAAITRVRFGSSESVTLMAPLATGTEEWTVERAFRLARSRRARVTSVDGDEGWRAAVLAAADRHAGVEVELLTLRSALPLLAFEPSGLDVVVSPALVAEALAGVTAAQPDGTRLAATGWISASGAGVFAPSHGAVSGIAGLGVANPSEMLLAAALMLDEGLGERSAARTLERAVEATLARGIRTIDRVQVGLAASTREFADAVLHELPGARTDTEFFLGATA